MDKLGISVILIEVIFNFFMILCTICGVNLISKKKIALGVISLILGVMILLCGSITVVNLAHVKANESYVTQLATTQETIISPEN